MTFNRAICVCAGTWLAASAHSASGQTDDSSLPHIEDETREPHFGTFFELSERQQWLLNPEPAPFPHSIGPDAETVAGRLLWLSDRISTPTAIASRFLSFDLDELKSDAPEFQTTEAVLSGLQAEQPLLEDLLAASRLSVVQFHAEGDPGARERAEHDPMKKGTSIFRDASQLLLCDAVRVWHAGDHDAAVERVAASLRLALPPDGVSEPLVALSRIAVLNLTEELVVAMVESGLTDAQRRVLIRELERFDAADPACIGDAWVHRARGWIEYAHARLDGELVEDELRYALARQLFRARMMRSIGEAFGNEPEQAALIGDPDSATYEQYLASLELLETLLIQAPEDITGNSFKAWWDDAEVQILADISGFSYVATQWAPVSRQGLIDSRIAYRLMMDSLAP